jgi:hypothetical protein
VLRQQELAEKMTKEHCRQAKLTRLGRMPWIAWMRIASPSAERARPFKLMIPDETRTGRNRLDAQKNIGRQFQLYLAQSQGKAGRDLLDDETVPLLLVGSEEAHASVGSGPDLEAGRLLGLGEGDGDLKLLGQIGVDLVLLLTVGRAGVLDLLWSPVGK